MSIKMYFAPAAIFLDVTEARSCGSMSRFRSRSTWMILSSEGESAKEPPHARQPLCFSTMLVIFLRESSTFAIVSIVSAVPAAEVIALDEVFGNLIPSAAQIATTIGVVRFPATPPMQCLSATYFPLNFNLAPVFTIAFVRLTVSENFIPFSFSAAVKNAISASVRLFCIISSIKNFSSFSVNVSPSIFFLIRNEASEISDEEISTPVPDFSFRTLKSSCEIPISFCLTIFEKISTIA